MTFLADTIAIKYCADIRTSIELVIYTYEEFCLTNKEQGSRVSQNGLRSSTKKESCMSMVSHLRVYLFALTLTTAQIRCYRLLLANIYRKKHIFLSD